VALDVEPRVEVVAHLDEVEARLLGADRLADEVLRSEGLGRELVADLHGRRPHCRVRVREGLPGRSAAETTRRTARSGQPQEGRRHPRDRRPDRAGGA
jgi:hypothetical protein